MLQRWLIYLSSVICSSSIIEHVLNSISLRVIFYLPQKKILGLGANELDSCLTGDDSKKARSTQAWFHFVSSGKAKQKVFFLLKANHEPLMGNIKMLCQTSTNGCFLSLAPLECWHWVQQNKKVKAGGGSEAQKAHNESRTLVLATEALCWLQPLSARAGGQSFVLQKPCHQIPCFSNSLWGQIPKDVASSWALPPWLTSTFCSYVMGQMQNIIWPISNDSFHFLKHLTWRKGDDRRLRQPEHVINRWADVLMLKQCRYGQMKSWD